MKKSKRYVPRTAQPKVALPTFLVSIIIPVYGRFDLLKKCLDSIPKAFTNTSYEIILVDNGSPDEEKVQFYSTIKSNINTKIVYNKKNEGFPKACNRGASLSSGVLLFFLNSDVMLDPGSGDNIVKNFDNANTGVVGMKLVFPTESELEEASLKHSEFQRNPGKIQHAGLFTNLRGQIFHMYLSWSENHPRVNQVHEVFAVTGAALMIRKKDFYGVGMFDLAFGYGTYEDVDLCMKIAKSGKKIICDMKSSAKHYTGSTAEKYNTAFPLNQNEVIFRQKWYNHLHWDEWKAW